MGANSLMICSQVTSSHILNLKRSQKITADQLRSLLELNGKILLRTQLKMFSSSTMLHGADIARLLLLTGKTLEKLSKETTALSLVNSMPPRMKLRVLKFKVIQPSYSIQRVQRKEFHMTEKENSSHL